MARVKLTGERPMQLRRIEWGNILPVEWEGEELSFLSVAFSALYFVPS